MSPAVVRKGVLQGGQISSSNAAGVRVCPSFDTESATLAPITPGQVLARVALDEALVVARPSQVGPPGTFASVATDFPFPLGSWVSRSYWRAADWDARLVSLLLFHRVVLGSASHMSAYIHSLPSSLYTAADLSGDALADLQYQPAIDSVECFQYRLHAEYSRFISSITNYSLRSSVTIDLYRWAMKIVHSRAFSVPPGSFAAEYTRASSRQSSTNDPSAISLSKPSRFSAYPGSADWPSMFALVPVLDQLHHGAGEGLARLRYNHVDNVFELIAGDNELRDNSPVLVSYGRNLTNDDLYLFYGFVHAGNPADVHEVEDLDHWAADDPVNRDWNLFDSKLRVLNATGLFYDGRKYFLSRSDVDPDMVTALRILLATPDEFEYLMKAYQRHFNDTRGKHADKPDWLYAQDVEFSPLSLAASSSGHSAPPSWYRPLSIESETKIWSRIDIQLKRLLAEYPTTLDFDEELILLLTATSSSADPKVSTPLLFRVEKKRILRDAIKLASEQAQRLARAAKVLGRSTD